MSPPGRPKGEYRSAQHGGSSSEPAGPLPRASTAARRAEGRPVSADPAARGAEGSPASRLQAQDLSVELDGEAGIVRALASLSLAIERGETFALVGESGCGKSMTALALLRLLPDSGRVAAGRVLLGDTDLVALPESRMRLLRGRRIGMIFQ